MLLVCLGSSSGRSLGCFFLLLCFLTVSLETSPKNVMIQDMINSENSMNTTESKYTNIFNEKNSWIINAKIIKIYKLSNH